MPIRRTLPTLATLLWLLGAAPVAADCELPGPIEEELARAPIAFVGTVVDVEGSRARFEVREVWAGDVPAAVLVYGLIGPNAPKIGEQRGIDPAVVAGMPPPMSEDDRTWQVGETYLVLPYVDGGALHDNICTATTEWGPQLEALRPEDARVPTAEQRGGAMSVVVAVVAAVALIATGSILAFRRR